MAILSLASISMAWFSWICIEKPFRNRNIARAKKILLVSLSGVSAFMFVGMLGQTGAVPSRLVIEEFEGWRDDSGCVVQGAANPEHLKSMLANDCLGSEHNFILIGDSHAEALSSAFRSVIENVDGHLLTLISNGCFPIVGTSREPYQQDCFLDKRNYWDFIKTTDATIIISTRWRLNLVGTRFDNQEGGVEYGSDGKNTVVEGEADVIDHTIDFLKEVAQERRLIIINQIPEAGWNVPQRVARVSKFVRDQSEIYTSYEVYKNSNELVNNMFSILDADGNVDVLKTDDLVCGGKTQDKCRNTLNGSSLYRDDDHPSPLFAALIAERFAEQILHD
ncbi:SGNH hydrolase domain-containing protein [Henriciella sp.]|uniref:SGNH hydrolase domain-containing protein n=1 Tax=Henriciella sp. TaxID=1968823 RepID=UPI0025C39615|nr:SGNH hydrolase domain-containing protein [Henriciella sp.]